MKTGAGKGHKKLAAVLGVEFSEIDLCQYHRISGLAFESIKRFDQELAITVFGLTARVVALLAFECDLV